MATRDERDKRNRRPTATALGATGSAPASRSTVLGNPGGSGGGSRKTPSRSGGSGGGSRKTPSRSGGNKPTATALGAPSSGSTRRSSQPSSRGAVLGLPGEANPRRSEVLGQTASQKEPDLGRYSAVDTNVDGVTRLQGRGGGNPIFTNRSDLDKVFAETDGRGSGDAAAAVLSRTTPQMGQGPAGRSARAGSEPGMGGGRAVMIGGDDDSYARSQLDKIASEMESVASSFGSEYGGPEGRRAYLKQLGSMYNALTGVEGEQIHADTALTTARMGEQGAMRRMQMKTAGALQRAVREGRMTAAQAQREFQRQMALQQQEAGLERGNLQYEFENDPRVAASAANTRDEMMSRRTQDALDYMNLDAETNQAVLKALSDPTTRDAMLQFIGRQYGFQPQEQRANGGMIGGPMMDDTGNPVEMFAGGGAVGAVTPFGQSPEAEDMIPGMRQYGQYVATAAENGVEPVGPDEFMNLLAQGRAARQNPATASQVNLANGGPVPGGDFVPGTEDVDGAMVLDQTRTPDMAGSDNIPAVIDGERPAALTSGEYVIPAEVVKIKGTEFFDNLLAKYMQEEEQGATPAQGQGKPQGQTRGMT